MGLAHAHYLKVLFAYLGCYHFMDCYIKMGIAEQRLKLYKYINIYSVAVVETVFSSSLIVRLHNGENRSKLVDF